MKFLCKHVCSGWRYNLFESKWKDFVMDEALFGEILGLPTHGLSTV